MKVIAQADIQKLVATPSGMVLGRIIHVMPSSFLLQEDDGRTIRLPEDCVFTHELLIVADLRGGPGGVI